MDFVSYIPAIVPVSYTHLDVYKRQDYGRRVIVCEDAGDGWVRIRTAELQGYVKLEYLQAE